MYTNVCIYLYKVYLYLMVGMGRLCCGYQVGNLQIYWVEAGVTLHYTVFKIRQNVCWGGGGRGVMGTHLGCRGGHFHL